MAEVARLEDPVVPIDGARKDAVKISSFMDCLEGVFRMEEVGGER